MRSKSVENFFQRSYSDARLPPDFITDPPPPSPPLMPGSPLVGERSPSISPSLSPNPSISSHSPSLSLSPSLPAKPSRPQINHCFQDHVFRKPTNCQHCKHMIVGKVLCTLPWNQVGLFPKGCSLIWRTTQGRKSMQEKRKTASTSQTKFYSTFNLDGLP